MRLALISITLISLGLFLGLEVAHLRDNLWYHWTLQQFDPLYAYSGLLSFFLMPYVINIYSLSRIPEATLAERSLSFLPLANFTMPRTLWQRSDVPFLRTRFYINLLFWIVSVSSALVFFLNFATAKIFLSVVDIPLKLLMCVNVIPLVYGESRPTAHNSM